MAGKGQTRTGPRPMPSSSPFLPYHFTQYASWFSFVIWRSLTHRDFQKSMNVSGLGWTGAMRKEEIWVAMRNKVQTTFYDVPFCLWALNPVCVCVCVCACVFTLWGRRCKKTLFQTAWRIQPPRPPSSEISPSLLISLLLHALMLTFPALEFAGSSHLYFHTTSSE